MINSIKTVKTQLRAVVMPYIGGAAILALVAAILLFSLNVPGTAFLQGVLVGFSIVGNISAIRQFRKKGNH